jgi:hypothetical protein
MVVKHAAVTVLFTVCGALSSHLYVQNDDRRIASVPVPFALLCATLCWRSGRAFLATPGVIVSWLVAYMCAMWLSAEINVEFDSFGIVDNYLPMAVGGLVGGFGLGLCGAVFQGKSNWPLVYGAAIAGAISALPFGGWLALARSQSASSVQPAQRVILAISFAIWQGALGVYLYTASARDHRRSESESW